MWPCYKSWSAASVDHDYRRNGIVRRAGTLLSILVVENHDGWDKAKFCCKAELTISARQVKTLSTSSLATSFRSFTRAPLRALHAHLSFSYNEIGEVDYLSLSSIDEAIDISGKLFARFGNVVGSRSFVALEEVLLLMLGIER